MDNYIPEGLQEFTGYKNEFLKKNPKSYCTISRSYNGCSKSY